MKRPDQIFEAIDKDAGQQEYFCTGFNKLDRLLDGGFLRKELVVLGAETGTGKSYLADQIMWAMAQQGFKCAYFSLEISDEMIIGRLAAMVSRIPPMKIVKGIMSGEEKKVYEEAKQNISVWNDNMDLYDEVYALGEIEGIVKREKYDFVIVDFIQNVMNKGDEYERLTDTALRLQKLAKDTNSCVLILSQLSNSAVKGDRLEYKGSGGIAMVADLGFFLTKMKDISRGGQEVIELELRKNRRGVAGVKIDYKFKLPEGGLYEA